MEDRRIRLVVLFGGRSAEHDVSCVSARHVVAAADPERYAVEPIGITREGRWVRAAEALEALGAGPAALPERLSATGPRVDPLPVLAAGAGAGGPTVVLPILHGPMGEDGTVQGLLELAGVPYAGAGVLASALCMDKTAANTMLAAAGIAHARWRALVLDDPQVGDAELAPILDDIIEELGLPVFVKPASMGSSVGITRATTHQAVAEGLRLACRYDRSIIVEEEARAREIEVAVLGNDDPEASLPGEIVPGAEFYDYADKYEDGAELLIPAPLDDDEVATCQSLAIDAYRALRVEGLARVDFLYEDGRDGRGDRGWMVSELNTMPGFTPISMYPKLWDASGLPYPQLIDRLVDLALERHARQELHTHTDPEAASRTGG
ncbi:MAG: D-alanine--D-alanine ligase [Acidimicrobiaceae bacterium]|nr:D-alanine--D-alanine ligase [Acidimicrobiaceae bacterium]MYL03796.1 D-alanine--D-alanine ligase [Acidimicrobiaceae bacterium]